MPSKRTISDLSAERMVLEEFGGRKTVLKFVTPKNWHVGDTVTMYINRNPTDYDWGDDGKLVIRIPPEPANEWTREFYTLRNHRTKDWITVDFDWVEGFEELLRKYRAGHQ